MFSILVVEDDLALNKIICTKLQQSEFQVYSALDGQIALDMMETIYIDLIICDIMMPNMDGLELTKALRRAKYSIPILMITAKDQMKDLEKGFLAGTDDYMIKPIRLKELLLRVEALLRRSKIAAEKKLSFGQVILDYNALTVKIGDELMDLPPKEFYLLFKLLNYPGKIFTRMQIMDEIWGMDSEADERTIDAHIKKLRRKFENYSDFEIVTIRGIGYKAMIPERSFDEKRP
jgi:DNA-binding response OmpR family regulator